MSADGRESAAPGTRIGRWAVACRGIATPSPRALRTLAIAAGPAAFAAVLALPAPGLSTAAHRLAAVFAWTVAYWLLQPIPLAVTALLSSVLAIALGVAPARDVLAPYADPVIFVFVGSFVLANAMGSTGLDRRFAGALLRQSWANRTPGRLLGAVGVITCAVSLWVSNTATTAMMLPIGTGLLRALGRVADRRTSRYPIGMLLMLTWASSVAVGVPVGSPPNLIAIGSLRDLGGRRLSFFEWFALTMPLTVAMLVVCWAILRWLYREPSDTGDEPDRVLATEGVRVGRWTTAERSAGAVFGTAVALWMAPGMVSLAAGDSAAARWLDARLPESVVAIAAAVALFILPTGLLEGAQGSAWKRMAAIDWGVILLFGGGLSLGRLMFETRLAETLGQALVGVSGAGTLWSFTAAAIAAGVLLSEVCSNTAAASMLVPVVIAAAQAAGISAIPPAVGAALGASFGFMLPVSTPPNAIVYGSGLVPLRDMIRAGLVLDVVGAALIWVTLRLLCPVLGLA